MSARARSGRQPATIALAPDAPCTVLPGIGPVLAARLAAKGLGTVEDLLWWVPRRYVDLRRVVSLAEAVHLAPDGPVTLVAEVLSARNARVARRFLEVRLGDPAGARAVARWFRVPAGMIVRFVPGARVVLSGRLRKRGQSWEMANPELLGDPDDGTLPGIRPRYPAVEGVAAGIIRRTCRLAVLAAGPRLRDGVPNALAARHSLPSLCEALGNLHAPDSSLTVAEVDALNRGESTWHQRLAFDDLFFLALAVARRGAERRRGEATRCGDWAGAAAFEAAIPFALTFGQRRAMAEIADDLARPTPMNRLLQGDVGCGKTVVALAAACQVIASGGQVAIMAPTELLAEQHALTLASLATHLGQRVALITASTSTRERDATLAGLLAGTVPLIVGTHALLGERVEFRSLGLVVIDEQQRFGVGQRARLREKAGGGGRDAHLLVMTATPIPRTLALTYYGDLDVTTIGDLPPGRTPPVTRVLSGRRGHAAARRLLQLAVEAGQRAFVVCPLAVPGEGPAAGADATTTATRLAEELAPARVGLVTGQQPAAQRAAVMSAFASGEVSVLVATTVVEVGVDVPEARLMLVEDADRFGLAQLHQLRGRVGRGPFESTCLLCCRHGRETEAAARLHALAATHDGFRIAEEDLARRGPGEILGERQTGLPRLRFGDVARHAALAEIARREARAVLAADPGLDLKEHEATRVVLTARLACAAVAPALAG